MELVTYQTSDRIGYITLNRPEKRNALSAQLVSALKEIFQAAEKDELAKVLVLKAEGEAFCAGADLAYLQELQHYSYEENLADSNHLKDLFLTIYTLKKVVIAQVQGAALAGGCGLATVCDFTVASAMAKFGYTEVKIGFIPAIVSLFLIRKLGEGKAKQLLLSGELMPAEEAARFGLINRVVEPQALDREVRQLATKLIQNNSAESMALTKKLIAEVQGLSLMDGLSLASAMNAQARSTEDCKKGIAAFLSKSELKW
jgi:methylglutaconyl-CoA hydratase